MVKQSRVQSRRKRSKGKNQNNGIYGEIQPCIDFIKKQLYSPCKDPFSRYSIVKTLSGGKSGASVYLVKNNKTGTNAILKSYAEINIKSKDADRPLRDIYTTCAMSKTDGFPTVLDIGKMCPNNMYIVSGVVPGQPMLSIDPTKLTHKQFASILLQLINIFYKAEKKLGIFLHNDLHPDNIFIDMKDCSPKTITHGSLKFKITCPKVTVIDFDLAVSGEYKKNLRAYKTIKGIYFLPIKLMKWVTKYTGKRSLLPILQKSFTGENRDMVIWNVYYQVFSILNSRTHGKDVNIVQERCKSAKNCFSHPFLKILQVNKN